MFLILDALAAGEGQRLSALDVIGAGPRAVAGVLEEFDLDYRVVRVEDFRRKRFEADVLLVSAMSMDEPSLKGVIHRFKGPKLVGGPITSDPSVVRRLGFDIGVWGEGEKSLRMLLERGLAEGKIPDDLMDIPNLIFPDGRTNRLDYLPPEEFVKYRHSTRAVTHYRSIPHYRSSRVYVEVVRSCSNYNRPKIDADLDVCGVCGACYSEDLHRRQFCPQRIVPGCGYCSIPLLYGPPKSRSVEMIEEEISDLLELGVRRIVLSGADFLEFGRERLVKGPLTHPSIPGPNLEAIRELLETVVPLIKSRGGFVEVENVKPCLVDEDVARLLGRYLKGSSIHVGVETGDEWHSELIGRPCGPTEAVRAIKMLKRAGLKPYAYFIHSLPGQNEMVVRRTLKVMREVFEAGAEKITVYKFRPLPGTAFAGYEVRVTEGSKRIASLAIELNRRRKEEMVGSEVLAVVSRSYRSGEELYAYPLKGGPAIRLSSTKGVKEGEIVRVRITGVLSDKLVEGVVVGRRAS